MTKDPSSTPIDPVAAANDEARALARACKLTVRHLLAVLPERDPLGSHLTTLFR